MRYRLELYVVGNALQTHALYLWLNSRRKKTAYLSISGFLECGGEIEIWTLLKVLHYKPFSIIKHQKAKNPLTFRLTGFSKCGGEIEIWTLEGLQTLAGFQDRCFRPLSHLTKLLTRNVFAIPWKWAHSKYCRPTCKVLNAKIVQ